MNRLEIRPEELLPAILPLPPRPGAPLPEWAAFRRLRAEAGLARRPPQAPEPRAPGEAEPCRRLRRPATPPPRAWRFEPPMTEIAYAPPIPFSGEAARRAPAVARVIARTAAHYGFDVVELLAHRRRARVTLARQVGMYLAKTLTLRSLPEIGRRFAGRDHTTVLHAVRKIEALIATDAGLAADVAELTAELAGAPAESVTFAQWGFC